MAELLSQSTIDDDRNCHLVISMSLDKVDDFTEVMGDEFDVEITDRYEGDALVTIYNH